jgi:rRNA maturation protein Nop10
MIELTRRGSASFKEMYGFYPCPKCGQDINQQLDKICKHCGEGVHIPEKEKTRDRATRWSGAYSRKCPKGHEYPMNLRACPHCGEDAMAYMRKVMAMTGVGGGQWHSYGGKSWLAGRKI